ncbi:MAG: GNAT family N-acetyltransferase [bacterium]
MTSSCSTPAPCYAVKPSAPGGETLQICVHDDPGDILRLAPEWRGLMAGNPHARPFYDPAWHATWWRCLGSGAVHLCAVRKENGDLLAIAPLTLREDGVLRFIGGEDLSDYLDIVAIPGAYPDAWRALMAYLNGPEAPPWKEMRLHSVPADSPTAEFFSSYEGARVEKEDVCPVITLPGSWDDYTGMLGQREERELRRKIRKAHMEADLEYGSTLSAENLEADLKDFFRLHALSQPEKEEFWNERRQAFFREIAREMLQLGWLDLSIMRVHGQAVAANFSFDFEDRIYLYNSGYDPSERELSAGIVLLAQNIGQAIQAGRSTFDLLRGGEAYKYRFAAKDEIVFRIKLNRESK